MSTLPKASESTLFQRFCKAVQEEQHLALQQEIHEGGFSVFREFVDDFLELLKRYEDPQKDLVLQYLEKAKGLVPDPGSISPAWQKLWEEYEEIIRYKNLAIERIAPEERPGEWQVILDNPYINQQVVCYPGLTFIEAAYLYGYFHPGLVQNEYLRLQKVKTLLMNHGLDA